MSIYYRSPQAYQDLGASGMLILPSKRLLQFYKNSVPHAPCIADDNFQWMVKEANKKGIEEHGKRGGILIDEMTIQDDLKIIKKGDFWSIVGAIDMNNKRHNHKQ